MQSAPYAHDTLKKFRGELSLGFNIPSTKYK